VPWLTISPFSYFPRPTVVLKVLRHIVLHYCQAQLSFLGLSFNPNAEAAAYCVFFEGIHHGQAYR
jgi:hypothetical protein